MNQAPSPQHYNTLAPFRDWFRHGTPVLMYHKLGPCPRRTRIKGLYIGSRAFEKQLSELAAAGFRSVSVGQARSLPETPSIAITFDDGFQNVLEHGSEPLRKHRFKAIQFIVAGLIGRSNEWEQSSGEAVVKLMDATQIRGWLAQGHEIGAHSMTHPFLTRIPIKQAREEIRSSKHKLEDIFGLPISHFCYPYGDYNPAIRDLVEQAGYHSACSDEFGLNTPEVDPFALKRLTVRRPSRGLKVWKYKLNSLLRGRPA